MLKYFLWLAIFILPLSALSQSPRIEWKQGDTLTWNDFQEDTTLKSVYYFAPQIGYGFRPLQNNQLIISIKAVVYKSQAIKSTHNINLYGASKQLLQIAQLYFDINEVYARKFRKEFHQFSQKCSERKSSWIIEKGYKLQAKYMKQSSMELTELMSVYKENIATEANLIESWRKRVDAELQALGAYSDASDITLTVKKNVDG